MIPDAQSLWDQFQVSIIVFDAETGRRLEVQDYNYSVQFVVIRITAFPHRTDTARGVELGGPPSMVFESVVCKPVGLFAQPRSFIDELL